MQSNPKCKTPTQFCDPCFELIDWSIDANTGTSHRVHFPPQPHLFSPGNLDINNITIARQKQSNKQRRVKQKQMIKPSKNYQPSPISC